MRLKIDRLLIYILFAALLTGCGAAVEGEQVVDGVSPAESLTPAADVATTNGDGSGLANGGILAPTDPVADAGPDQNVPAGSVVTLDGSSSFDPTNKLLSYAWSFLSKPDGSAAALSDSTSVKPTFNADLEGAYTFELTVYTNNTNSTSTEKSRITVTASTANSAPIAHAGGDRWTKTGTLVKLDGSGSMDADREMLQFSWTLTPPQGSGASLSDPGDPAPTFSVDIDGTYSAALVVNDGALDSPSDTVTVTASSGNSKPEADAGQGENVSTGTAVTLNGGASRDADGDSLTYSWAFSTLPQGSGSSLLNTSTATPSFTTDVDGVYVISLTVNDGSENSTPSTVSVTASSGNSTPVAYAGSDQVVTPGTLITLDGSGSTDGDGDSLIYYWFFTSTPPGSSASLSDPWAAGPTFTADVAGSYVAALVVNDGGADSTASTVLITATPADKSFTLSWDAASGSPTGYKVYYKTTPPCASPFSGKGIVEGNSPIDVGNTTSKTLTGLFGGQTYYFSVTAYNGDGESGFSNCVEKTAP